MESRKKLKDVFSLKIGNKTVNFEYSKKNKKFQECITNILKKEVK